MKTVAKEDSRSVPQFSELDLHQEMNTDREMNISEEADLAEEAEDAVPALEPETVLQIPDTIPSRRTTSSMISSRSPGASIMSSEGDGSVYSYDTDGEGNYSHMVSPIQHDDEDDVEPVGATGFMMDDVDEDEARDVLPATAGRSTPPRIKSGYMMNDTPTYDSNFFIHRMESADILYAPARKAPKVVAQYVLGDVIGEGSYGKVREGFDGETLQRVAVKIMQKKRLRKIPNGEENVKREIALLRKLRHKNIIQLVQVLYNDEKQKMYVVLEFCGGVLQSVLERAPGKCIPASQAQRYFRQLIAGLVYMHARSVVHRDIKPGNLLLTVDGTLKISDFGVAEELDPHNKSDACVSSSGTPAFQPPEIALGHESFSGRLCDVWSCGVTLYNMLTGMYPFEGDNVYQLFENIGRGEYEMPEQFDELLRHLIAGMLQKDAKDRLYVEQIALHPWLNMTIEKSPHEVPLYIEPVVGINSASASPSTVQSRQVDSFVASRTTLIPYLEHLYVSASAPSLAAIDENGNPLPETNAVDPSNDCMGHEVPVQTGAARAVSVVAFGSVVSLASGPELAADAIAASDSSSSGSGSILSIHERDSNSRRPSRPSKPVSIRAGTGSSNHSLANGSVRSSNRSLKLAATPIPVSSLKQNVPETEPSNAVVPAISFPEVPLIPGAIQATLEAPLSVKPLSDSQPQLLNDQTEPQSSIFGRLRRSKTERSRTEKAASRSSWGFFSKKNVNDGTEEPPASGSSSNAKGSKVVSKISDRCKIQ